MGFRDRVNSRPSKIRRKGSLPWFRVATGHEGCLNRCQSLTVRLPAILTSSLNWRPWRPLRVSGGSFSTPAYNAFPSVSIREIAAATSSAVTRIFRPRTAPGSFAFWM